MNGSHENPLRDRTGRAVRVGDTVDVYEVQGRKRSGAWTGKPVLVLSGTVANTVAEGALVQPFDGSTAFWSTSDLIELQEQPSDLLKGVS